MARTLNIVILCNYDFSGNMYNVAKAVNRCTKHKAVAIKLRVNPQLQYPTMILATPENILKVRQTIYEADAVVFKEEPTLPRMYGLDVQRLKGKRIGVLLGGYGWRRTRNPNLETYVPMGARFAATSLDFLEKSPSFGWVPACIRLGDLREKYDRSKMDPPLIVTSPSKSTDEEYQVRKNFRLMVDNLRHRDLKFQFEEVFGVNNETCLAKKAHASIYFDRFLDIYGINSQEAAAFESAVITGCSNFVLNKLREYGFSCPFLIASNPLEAANMAEKLLHDGDYMRRKGRECYEYVEKLHSGRYSAERLVHLLGWKP